MRLQYNKAVSWSMDMTEKPKPESSLSSDVQVIRNILLGEHLEKFQKQVDALEKEVNALKRENKALLRELETENVKRFQELTARIEQAKNEQAGVGQAMSENFDSQIREIVKRLNAYEDGQGSLITSLAKALMDYKDKSGK